MVTHARRKVGPDFHLVHRREGEAACLEWPISGTPCAPEARPTCPRSAPRCCAHGGGTQHASTPEWWEQQVCPLAWLGGRRQWAGAGALESATWLPFLVGHLRCGFRKLGLFLPP